MSTLDRLKALTRLQLIALGQEMNKSGTFGKNYTLMGKDALVTYLWHAKTIAALDAALDDGAYLSRPITGKGNGKARTPAAYRLPPIQPPYSTPYEPQPEPPSQPEPPKEDPTVQTTPRSALDIALGAAVKDAVEALNINGKVDEDQVRAIVSDALATQDNRQPVEYHISAPSIPTFSTKGMHPDVARILALYALPLHAEDGITPLRPNVCVTGPPGTSKTYFGNLLAKHLGCEDRHAIESFNGGTSVSVLTGTVLPMGDGRHVPSQFMERFEHGGFMQADEFDAIPADVAMVMQTATSNGKWAVGYRKLNGLDPIMYRHDNSYFFATANTMLTGATAMHNTRESLDGATTDRWILIAIDYDAVFEASICGIDGGDYDAWEPVVRTADELKAALAVMHAWHKELRSKARTFGITRTRAVSSRMLLKGRACLTAGWSWSETKTVLLTGWTDDELTTVGESI